MNIKRRRFAPAVRLSGVPTRTARGRCRRPSRDSCPWRSGSASCLCRSRCGRRARRAPCEGEPYSSPACPPPSCSCRFSPLRHCTHPAMCTTENFQLGRRSLTDSLICFAPTFESSSSFDTIDGPSGSITTSLGSTLLKPLFLCSLATNYESGISLEKTIQLDSSN